MTLTTCVTVFLYMVDMYLPMDLRSLVPFSNEFFKIVFGLTRRNDLIRIFHEMESNVALFTNSVEM